MLTFERLYGTQTTIHFALWELDGTDLKTDAAHASGDITLSKDEGDYAAAANGFTDEGSTYSLVLTAAELQAARVMILVVDQTSPKAWLDCPILIETYGHASAQHTQTAINVTNGVVEANAVQISGDSTAADNLESYTDGTLPMPVNVTQVSGDANAADNLEAAADGTGYNLGGGSVVAASVTGAVGSVTGAVGSVTGNVGGNVAGSVGSVTGAVGSIASLDAAALQQIVDDLENGGRLDLLVDAIKAKTDSLTFTTANKVDATITRIGSANIQGAGTSGDKWRAS